MVRRFLRLRPRLPLLCLPVTCLMIAMPALSRTAEADGGSAMARAAEANTCDVGPRLMPPHPDVLTRLRQKGYDSITL
ncbi:MAG: hypothetical protein GTO22_07505, partial [Gemmatimonadales bacterium]|nr:hypothetical protein [Gemmatimonadales bacterium]